MNQTAASKGTVLPEPILASDPSADGGLLQSHLRFTVHYRSSHWARWSQLWSMTENRHRLKSTEGRDTRGLGGPCMKLLLSPLGSQPALPSWHPWVTVCTRVPRQESLSEPVSRVLSGGSFRGCDWLMHYSNDSSVYGPTDPMRPKGPTTNHNVPLSADCQVWLLPQKTGYFPQLWRRWPPRN